MNMMTQLEDLSNEIFLEIFDYLHALDIFMAFSSLNGRISSILCSTRLRVVVLRHHRRYQLELLSSHLIYHAHQVVSISLVDQRHDFPSTICFLFNRHTFINLESCSFFRISPSSRLYEVIQQLESLTKLVSFEIQEPNAVQFRQEDKLYLSRTMLTSKLTALRSVQLEYLFNHSDTINTATVNWNLTSITLRIDGSSNDLSIYCVLPILRTYRVLRHLHIIISNAIDSYRHHPVMPTLPSNYKDNLPISPSLLSFQLRTTMVCNAHSLSIIFRCMPNLHRFTFRLSPHCVVSTDTVDLVNGYRWQRLLIRHLPHLKRFDFFISIFVENWSINTEDTILNSFQYFVLQYDGWHLGLSRSRTWFNSRVQHINLCTITYPKKVLRRDPSELNIILGTFNIQSTAPSDAQHNLFNSHYSTLHTYVPRNSTVSDIVPLSPPFQNVNALVIDFEPSTTILWKYIRKIVPLNCSDDKMIQKETFNKFLCLVDLSTITALKFQSMNDLIQLHFIEQVLLACENVLELTIDSVWLFSPIFIDNPFLTSTFSQLLFLDLVTKHVYFPLKYGSKLVQRFPSLVEIELQVFSLDACIPLVHILITGLEKLVYLKINFSRDTLLDNPCSRDYVIEKRRQAFPTNSCNEDEVLVKITGESLEIFL